MIAQDIISDYQRLCNNVTDLIQLSGYRIEYVYEKMGLTRMGFYKKRKQGTFKPNELERIFSIIGHDNLEDKVLGQLMNKSKRTDKLTEKATKDLFNNI